MNSENEKLWFVYVGDHHEGPLSIEEVFVKKQQGHLTPESYVWREGMADWLMLHQVPDLESALNELLSAPAEEPAPVAEQNPAEEKAPVDATGEPALDPAKTSAATPAPSLASIPASAAKDRRPMAKILVRGLFLSVFIGAIVSAGALIAISRTSNPSLHERARPILETAVTRAPFLRNTVKLVPRIADISASDLAELDSARTAPIDSGASIGLAVSTTDPNRPFFYVASNLPNRTKLVLLIIGEPETLLNRLQFSTRADITLSHGFAKTETILMEGGQPIPKGEYMVYSFEADTQEDELKASLEAIPASRAQIRLPTDVPASAKFVSAKKLFLGGQRDEVYLTRLKAFHDSIRQKAERELSELKQYAETLILQHNALTGGFQKFYRAKKPQAALRSKWKQESEAWLQISGQLEQTIQTWTPDTLQNEFFYGKAYELIKNAYESMRSLFLLEMEFFEKGGDRDAFDIRHGKLLSETRQALDLMRTRTEVLFKAPKTAGGLPSREGL